MTVPNEEQLIDFEIERFFRTFSLKVLHPAYVKAFFINGVDKSVGTFF